MVDPTQKRGDTGRPMGPEPEKEQQVDPEKFKKVLKVEAPSEAEKRQKRRLKKGEEGNEDEEVEEQSSSPSAFAHLMQDQDGLDSLFAVESPTREEQAAPKTSRPPPPKGSISTEGVELEEEPPARAEPQAEAEAAPFSDEAPLLQTPQAAQQDREKIEDFLSPPPPYLDKASPKDQDQTIDLQAKAEPPSREEPPEKPRQRPSQKKEKDASLLSSQPEKKALRPKKKPSTKKGLEVKTMPYKKQKVRKQPSLKAKAPLAEKASPSQGGKASKIPANTNAAPKKEKRKKAKKAPPLEDPIKGKTHLPSEMQKESLSVKEREKRGETADGVLPLKQAKSGLPAEKKGATRVHVQAKKPMTFERLTPEQIRGQTKENGLALSATPFADGDKRDKQRKESQEDFPFIHAEQLIDALPTVDPPFQPSSPTHGPAYSTLSPETYELFEKMVGAIIIQDDSNIRSTTITLNMPNSIFNGSQVTLDQYQTAPNCYNLQLSGNPEAVEAFAANVADLVAAFQQGKHAFEVNILRPALIEKKPLIRRKGAAGGGGGDRREK